MNRTLLVAPPPPVRRAVRLLGFACALIGVSANAQTLFVPSGSGGIGTSTNGNIGVGTASPANAFEVRGITRISNGTDYGWIFAGSSGGLNAFHVGSFTNVPLAFFTNASAPKMTIDVSGNVGIGTTSPTTTLDVVGEIMARDSVIAYNSSNEGGRIRVQNGQKTGASTFDWSIWNMTGGYGNGLAFWRYFADGTNAGPSFWLSDSGNVGIGTTSPTQKLEVFGGYARITYANGPYLDFHHSAAGPDMKTTRLGSHDGALVFESVNDLYTAPTERMRIAAGGNVGIGTTSPTHKLSVNGTIRAKEVIVDTGWADHVFAADYRLAPLSEVEQHIQQNGHLPDVPSAADVAERGVSVGEMQNILLQKIEELTLHVIVQEKRLAAVEAENARLRQAAADLHH